MGGARAVSGAFDEYDRPVSDSCDSFEVAAYWHGLYEAGELDATLRERFDAWLAAHPDHRAAYASVENTWAGMANAGADERILAMRQDALAAPRTALFRRAKAPAMAASIVAAAMVVGVLIQRSTLSPRAGEFATQVGERSSITLADGTTVVLNTSSRMQVAFDQQIRRVHLLAGQAWFKVAKNQPRPFVVEAGGERVTAHGTAFDVRIEDHDRVQVTLVEGRVSVEMLKGVPEQGGGVTHEDLLPGDQLIVAAAAPVSKSRVDLAKATSWREGQIIFDDDTLAVAVAEVNRYSAKQIILADPRLASLRMSGVFLAGHSESFLETIVGNFPIKVTADAEGRLLLTATN
jgi:transmembrane sensor